LTVAYLGPISTVTFYGFGVIELSSAAANFLTLVWIVGLTNAYNFMDGIDGIAGGCGAVAGLGWLLIGQQVGSNVHVTLGSLILGATAGSLIFNWSPAKIFMGDVGSLVLGFVLAAAPLLLPERVHQQGTALWIGALVVWPFVVDAGLTFLLRAYRRERLMDAHRSHLYQCLVQDGRSHSFVASIYVALTVFGVIAATTLPF
jgi:UDP-N-acetylmuramyl pentapeptide phosphotransferase/UDP-N-acetylglucosamine-1-phosphate transferase